MLLDNLCTNGLTTRSAPSILLIAAHPDDETIGAAGRLVSQPKTTIVHVTDGAPADLRDATRCGCASREGYAQMRRDELHAALTLAGVPMERTRQLGWVDQQASLNLAGLACQIADLIRELKPDIVLTHSYEGGHPDHDATAFAVHAAVATLVRERHSIPDLIEFASYHDVNGAVAFEFLPCTRPVERTVLLSDQERALKQKMLDCFGSQHETLAAFPIAAERFRMAPHYHFTAPPHAGTLYYERPPWGMTWAQWRSLAAAAQAELGVGGAL